MSQWIDVLTQMDYRIAMLTEIPVMVGDKEPQNDVRCALERVQQLLHTGHYSSAVTECRKALEIAVNHLERLDAVRSAVKQYSLGKLERERMSKHQRLEYLINAVWHATHLGAHPDADNRRVDYARDEALMIYFGVAAAVNYLAQNMNPNQKKGDSHDQLFRCAAQERRRND